MKSKITAECLEENRLDLSTNVYGLPPQTPVDCRPLLNSGPFIWAYPCYAVRVVGTIMHILCAWLLADFISGLVHWWEDRAIAGASRFKFINGVREDNEKHHTSPRYFLELSWWENINTTAPFAWTLTAALALIHAPATITWAVFFLGFANLVHRFSHESKQNRNAVIDFLQTIGLFASPSHHSGHHFKRGKIVGRQDSRIRYCVMSSWLNPILDKSKFFRVLEWALRI